MLPAQLGTGGNNTPFVVEQTPFCKSARPRFKGDAPTYIPCKVTNTLNTFDTGESRANELVVETYPASRVRCIVRRLTPTECARLQGFADAWGHIEPKEDFTDEEYRFWLEVRNTRATINGKAVKEYTRPQMLTWYNKFWTDSAEYKMWGNGIALPPALYCMQGMAEALKKGEETMYYTDDPARDFLRREARREREMAKLPVCWECDEPIQDEEFYLIGDVPVCPKCLERNYRRRTEDYAG